VRLARQQAPARLSVSQLDPFTGKVTWPAALRRPAYDKFRGQIDTLFHAHATGTDLATGEINDLVSAWIEQLKADISSFRQTEYIAARNFLTSLAFEAGQLQQ
jgi:hypothetical protein